MISKEDIRKRNSKMFTNPGNRKKEIFHGVINAAGDIELLSDGFEDLQDYIDSFEEDCDIRNIVTRVQNGEIDLLNKAKGVYMDTVGLPKTQAEILQKVIDGERAFNLLPAEIKEKFDNDYRKWFVAMDEPDFMLKSGFIKEKEVVEEVKE